MGDREFKTRNAEAWCNAIETSLGGYPPDTATWTDPRSIVHVLEPFLKKNLDHAMLPGGGGLDLEGISLSRESGCLDLFSGERSSILVSPKSITFEYIFWAPSESFFLMDLYELDPSGVYESVASESEPLLEIDGEYRDYAESERGFIGYDTEGIEIPVPEDARLVFRKLRGKILIVAKSGCWNSLQDTYDARHVTMTSYQVREFIEKNAK